MVSKLLTPAHERFYDTLVLLAARENFVYESDTKNTSSSMRAELGFNPREWTNLLHILQSRHLLYAMRTDPNSRYYTRIGLSMRNAMQSTEPYVTDDVRDAIVANPSYSDSFLDY